MARFAEYANKAAKSLSTTTTAYTDAALIFYQQGLGDKDVQERTDITVKMANATGESVTTVSDQLTAIWNNFNKEGDVAYEHYADVLTALGAKTASSTDEIAGGLEKFAAIADTIGLSYEYAAAALATITSNTRQSEEVVGTALKTIFARLQGLKLGETLEDGTDLNKYSEALQKVGVEVLDASGELRRADDILKDMAARWETLSNAEQVALAQAVGGVRQYNQIVALMNEWDSGDSDSMLANLETAYNADGSL
jgi:TP901 family phage tail tape measure protein